MMESGKTVDETLGELEKAFAEREPQVRAFIPEANRFARLRVEAHELEERFPDPAARPPLYGIPIGIKDIFRVDGFETGGGSRLPPSVLAGSQAASVSRLQEAGALILGKTVSTEFAYFAPGPTRNPHDLKRTPGGSSSGSAAGVAAGLCPLALGTQTIGSICRPASYCGVVGFKPSYGAVSTEGVIPLSQSLDHVGWFTRNLALSLQVAEISGLNVSPIEKEVAVVGVPEGPYLDRTGVGLDLFRAACKRLEASAAVDVRYVDAFPDFDEIARRHRLIVAAECAAVHEDWFLRFGELYDSRTAELILEGQAVSAGQLEAALAGREKLRTELADLMHEHGLDAWLSPASQGPAPLGLDSTGDPIMNLPWTHAGVPAVSIPMLRSLEGLPMGLQISADFGNDGHAFSVARITQGALS